MSHYLMWVIGDNVDEQLAPFEEGSPTAFTVVELEKLSDAIRTMGYDGVMTHIAQCLKEKDPVAIVSEAMLYDKDGQIGPVIQDLCGMCVNSILVADEETGKLKALKRVSHENGKWDWYVVGGRWAGHFLIKPGVTPPNNAIKGGEEENRLRREFNLGPGSRGSLQQTELDLPSDEYDALPKKYIDFEEMERRALKESQFIFDLHRIVEGLDFQTIEECHQTLKKELGSVEKDKAFYDQVRSMYDNQPAMKAIKESGKEIPFLFNTELLKVPKDKLEQVVAGRGWQPLCILHNGKWEEKGRMGWFGIVDDEMGLVEWDQFCRDKLDELDDDTLLVAVDCHT